MEGAHYSPNVTLRGEIGVSLIRERVLNDRINYIKGIQRNINDLLESILWTIQTEQETKWIKTTRKYMKNVNISFNDIHKKSKEYLKQFMIKSGSKRHSLHAVELSQWYGKPCANCVYLSLPQQWGPDYRFWASRPCGPTG